MIDAGLRSASALCANNVSPRVTDVTMTPHVPPRVWAPSTMPRSLASAEADRGDDHDGPTGAVARAVRTGVRRGVVRPRVVARLRCGTALLVAPAPTAATEGATLPSVFPCAAMPGAASKASSTSMNDTYVVRLVSTCVITDCIGKGQLAFQCL